MEILKLNILPQDNEDFINNTVTVEIIYTMTALEHEVNFWKGFIQTERFLKGWCGPDKTPELSDEVYNFIRSVPHDRVLDVGSGVVSILTGTVKKHQLTAFDPLAEEYEKIFDYSADPYWETISQPISWGVEGVKPDGFFDIVHISNALDHSQDPKQGYLNLMGAVKPGGYLIIQGFVNEGAFEKYAGFHQWNLSIEEDATHGTLLVCKNSKMENHFRISKPLSSSTIRLETGRDWFIWIMKR